MNSLENEEDDNDFLESVGIKATYYNNMVDRYFTKYYINKGTDNEQYIFIHSNGILLCGLGKNNIITKQNIDHIVDLKKPGKITGRKKHGAHFLSDNEKVISIFYGDNKVYNFCPTIKGKLLEVNDNIIDNPKLINNSPEDLGFICIIFQNQNMLDELKQKLENSQ